MKKVTINLYEFKELGKESKERAIQEHKEFLDLMPVEVENEEGEMEDEYYNHSKDEIIDSIEANEYVYFESGEMAQCVTYTGKHEKSGQTEFTFHGRIYSI